MGQIYDAIIHFILICLLCSGAASCITSSLSYRLFRDYTSFVFLSFTNRYIYIRHHPPSPVISLPFLPSTPMSLAQTPTDQPLDASSNEVSLLDANRRLASVIRDHFLIGASQTRRQPFNFSNPSSESGNTPQFQTLPSQSSSQVS